MDLAQDQVITHTCLGRTTRVTPLARSLLEEVVGGGLCDALPCSMRRHAIGVTSLEGWVTAGVSTVGSELVEIGVIGFTGAATPANPGTWL
jgi:hypothetical protein